jgi:protein-disulfide isomerase
VQADEDIHKRSERMKKTRILGVVAAVAIMMTAAAFAAGDTSALHPPAGAHVALVTFEDLECPACAHAQPLLQQAQRAYSIPLIWHDFIIPNHPWSREAAIMARYFDEHPTPQSPHLGEEFRAYIFANQPQIFKANLREWADKFAAQHHTALPAFYDPTGKLAAKVEADTQLGRNTGPTGVLHTPTIYVVSDSQQMPYVEVTDQGKLFETIEQVKASVHSSNGAKAKKTTVAKKLE